MANPPTPEFLDWVADRFVAQGESENVDFVLRLRAEAEKGRIIREELGNNEHFYCLQKLDGPHMDGTTTYQLHRADGPGGFGHMLYLDTQQASDLDKQLDVAALVLDDLRLHDQHDQPNTNHDTRTD